MDHLNRRNFLAACGVDATLVALPPALPASAASRRAVFHVTPPSGWLCDPQRPIHLGGRTHLYYLHSDQDNAPGWWQHATTQDLVYFTDAGTAIPLAPDFPVWTGSLVVDTANTAGLGAGTVIALATQPTGGDRYDQEQYLYYSLDGGCNFTPWAPPVIDNPEHSDWFRDPKVHWDGAQNRWVAVIGRLQSAVFYTSTDLVHWTYGSSFAYSSPNIVGFECPDLFEMEADDGTWHWVLGASMQGDYTGKPDTFSYWRGCFDGETYQPDNRDPQWLDWGWDWYAAVTWPSEDNPRTKRYALGWMNNWQYAARSVPTNATDGYNGQMSVVRELRLDRQPEGWYTLLSQPVSTLAAQDSRVVRLADQTVSGSAVLPYHGEAYELEIDLSWTQLTNVRLSVGRSAEGPGTPLSGSSATASTSTVGRRTARTSRSVGYAEHRPVDPAARSVHLLVLVDRQSVEVFVNAGHTGLSQQVYFQPGEDGISLYTDGGSADFRNIVVREF